MPDLVMHHYFGREVYNKLPKQIKENIDLNIYDFATAGPDPFFFISFLKRKQNSKYFAFGSLMHRQKTAAFLKGLVNLACDYRNLQGYLYGFITHYFLDSIIHPYVFYFTGNYNPDDLKTKEFRGLHTKLERALDSYIIKKYYYKKPHKFKIYKKILTLKKLDYSFKKPLDQVYKEVYNLEDGFFLVNKSIKDQRRFYRFIYDRWGIKNKLFSFLDDGKSSLDLSVLSYYRKEISDIDIFNNQKREWTNPVDNKIISNESFFELFAKAKAKALQAIEAVFEYFENKEINLDEYLRDNSYITGLPCNDARPLRSFQNIFAE